MIMNAGQHGSNTGGRSEASGERSLAAYLHSHLIAPAAGERLFKQAAKSCRTRRTVKLLAGSGGK